MANQNVSDIFAKLRARLIPILNELPEVVGNAGVNYSLDALEKQAWEDEAWAKRQSKKDADRALLIKSGRLRRSIKVLRSSQNSVVWGSADVPYAQIHNDGGIIERPARSETFARPRYKRGKKAAMFGGMGAFRKMTREERKATPQKGQRYRAYTITMPQRRFIGDTPALRAVLHKAAKDYIIEKLSET